jgi:hypothetical protein
VHTSVHLVGESLGKIKLGKSVSRLKDNIGKIQHEYYNQHNCLGLMVFLFLTINNYTIFLGPLQALRELTYQSS